MTSTRKNAHTTDSRLLVVVRWLCLGVALAVPGLWQNLVGEGGLLHAHEMLRCQSDVTPPSSDPQADDDSFDHDLLLNPLMASEAGPEDSGTGLAP
jgi:hypothetical protein